MDNMVDVKKISVTINNTETNTEDPTLFIMDRIDSYINSRRSEICMAVKDIKKLKKEIFKWCRRSLITLLVIGTMLLQFIIRTDSIYNNYRRGGQIKDANDIIIGAVIITLLIPGVMILCTVIPRMKKIKKINNEKVLSEKEITRSVKQKTDLRNHLIMVQLLHSRN